MPLKSAKTGKYFLIDFSILFHPLIFNKTDIGQMLCSTRILLKKGGQFSCPPPAFYRFLFVCCVVLSLPSIYECCHNAIPVAGTLCILK